MTLKPPTVAIFRARADAEATAAALAARQIEPVLAPVTELFAVDAPPPAGPFDFVVASSAKAIALASPDTLTAARGTPLYVVGEATAAAARAAGLAVAASAAEVAALLPLLPSGRALYLAGRDRKPELEAALERRIATHLVYEARARARWDDSEAQAVARAQAALHYSERGAKLAADLAQQAGLAAAFRRLPHVCLSRAVAAPLAALGVTRALWPRAPNEAALLEALEAALADLTGL